MGPCASAVLRSASVQHSAKETDSCWSLYESAQFSPLSLNGPATTTAATTHAPENCTPAPIVTLSPPVGSIGYDQKECSGVTSEVRGVPIWEALV
jgi:hypothetical protein